MILDEEKYIDRLLEFRQELDRLSQGLDRAVSLSGELSGKTYDHEERISKLESPPEVTVAEKEDEDRESEVKEAPEVEEVKIDPAPVKDEPEPVKRSWLF